MDTDSIKQNVDCRLVVQDDLGPPKHRGSAAWVWACPFHGEQSGTSFAVWPNGWHCFGKCGEGGDVIDWIMRRRNLDFRAALEALSPGALESSRLARPSRPPEPRAPSFKEPPSPEWQAAALEGVDRASWTLTQRAGVDALRWLRMGRGLSIDTIRDAQIGYNPSWLRLKYHDAEGRQLVMPPGIVLPWLVKGTLWTVRIRTRTGALAQALNMPDETGRDGKPWASKYTSLRGGNAAGLYWAEHIVTGWPVVLTEGEFNALALWQEGMDRVCPCSLGSASTTLNPLWYARLCSAGALYAYYDLDEAGAKARERLASIAGGVKFLSLPNGHKDLNDFLKAEGWRGMRDWLDQVLGERVGA